MSTTDIVFDVDVLEDAEILSVEALDDAHRVVLDEELEAHRRDSGDVLDWEELFEGLRSG